MPENKNASIHLDIYSDVICPWCYVGKARLDEALKSLGKKLNVTLDWRPFELNPSMSSEGADRKEYMQKKFGTADLSGMQTRLTTAGAENGVQFNFSSIRRVPNTFKAHRLIWFAGTKAKQHEVCEILFRKYFHDGEDVGDTQVLVSAAQEAGLDAEEARKFLNSTSAEDEVRQEEYKGRLMGINAVPTFVLNGEIIASGAVPPYELIAAIEAAILTHSKK